MKFFTSFIISFISIFNLSAQSNFLEVDLSSGKLFVPNNVNISYLQSDVYYTNYFMCYDGKFDFHANINYFFSKKMAISTSYLYAFMYNQRLNSNGYIHNCILGITYKIFEKKKFSPLLFLGSGFEYIYIKSLYDFYEYHEEMNGISLNLRLRLKYQISSNLGIFFSPQAIYGFMYYDEKISSHEFYSRTLFYFTDLGISYSFGKEKKE